MKVQNFEALQVGDELPVLTIEPMSRLTLALYAGASGDHNPIHVDIDFARKAGMPDVFAHGMLSMAYLGRLLTNWVEQAAVRTFSVRFAAITHVGEIITCRGTIVEKFEDGGENFIRLDVSTRNRAGEMTLEGQAVVAFAGKKRNAATLMPCSSRRSIE